MNWKLQARKLLSQANLLEAVKIMQENGCDIPYLEQEAIKVEEAFESGNPDVLDLQEELIKALLTYL